MPIRDWFEAKNVTTRPDFFNVDACATTMEKKKKKTEEF